MTGPIQPKWYEVLLGLPRILLSFLRDLIRKEI